MNNYQTAQIKQRNGVHALSGTCTPVTRSVRQEYRQATALNHGQMRWR
ncbi:hypothetical protein CAter282_4582 [Collimonas arenae]|uniref:Uncharacterized protein n=1 Tax=Collimonas arenae TaxID=279058 RepID=A0A127QQC7_9BURK|nr:hypothetical protein CAter10_4988 [Collimonas arenae]AMP12239.1 hypothetical protein CAter282_4582 [Collimonas arenae]